MLTHCQWPRGREEETQKEWSRSPQCWHPGPVWCTAGQACPASHLQQWWRYVEWGMGSALSQWHSGWDSVGTTAAAHTCNCRVSEVRWLDWGLGEEQSQVGPCLTLIYFPSPNVPVPIPVPGSQHVLSKALLLNSNTSRHLCNNWAPYKVHLILTNLWGRCCFLPPFYWSANPYSESIKQLIWGHRASIWLD